MIKAIILAVSMMLACVSAMPMPHTAYIDPVYGGVNTYPVNTVGGIGRPGYPIGGGIGTIGQPVYPIGGGIGTVGTTYPVGGGIGTVGTGGYPIGGGIGTVGTGGYPIGGIGRVY